MKNSERQQFSIKCECTVLKGNVQVNGSRKSKFSLISLDSVKKCLSVLPFAAQKQEASLTFSIVKLKTIHKKYIDEGKATFQFLEKTERVSMKGVDVSAIYEQVEVISSIFVSSASKQNLELLISKIIDIKKQQKKGEVKVSSDHPKPVVKKKPVMPDNYEEMRTGFVSRKEMIKMATAPAPIVKKIQKVVQAKKDKYLNFMQLPTHLIDNIFQYCQFSLSLRVINRRFSEYILKNIHSIRVKQEIDETTFNKLCKWAVNVEGKMKNVKNIDILDRYEQQQLVKNRAKTLRFGAWKDITARNANQLKGLRIYCLEIPYQIKFEFEHFFGIRMVQLRLKSPCLVTKRNDCVRSEDIAHLLNTIKDLRVFQTAYCNFNLLNMIEHPSRLTQLNINYMKDVEDVIDLSKFQKLTSLSLWYLQKGGAKKQNHEIKFVLPQSLTGLEIGSFISEQNLQAMPLNIEYLKLIGDGFYNFHLKNIYLPKLKYLDITLSKNIRQQSLEYMQNMRVVTSWDKETVNYMSNYMAGRNLIISTIN